MARVITFYSYKGGTGRSMALANVAWVLASNQRRVLVIDWDLEAPGLHHYFRPFLGDPALSGYSIQGVIDLVIAYAAAAATPPASRESDPKLPRDWWRSYANFGRLAIPLRWPSGDPLFAHRGKIDFLPAGRQDGEGYASRVNSFDWKHFYLELNGGGFLHAVKESFRDYDYVLIDSRTGVSDTSGICTIQLPDALVLCYTLNNQSISGAGAAGLSARTQRPEMPIFPIAMRVDPFERDRANLRREYARTIFGGLVEDLHRQMNPALLEDYWSLEMQYFASYAYEEGLSGFDKFTTATGSLHPKVQRLANVITNGDVVDRAPAPEEAVRTEVLAEYAQLPVLQLEPAAAPAIRRRSWVTLWAAAITWLALAVLLVFVIYRSIASASHDRVMAGLLVSYAERHENQTQDAAVALAAAEGLPVPDRAREIGRKLLGKVFIAASVSGHFESAALSPDNRSYVVSNGSQVSQFSVDNSNRTHQSFATRFQVERVEYSADGTKVVALGDAAEIRSAQDFEDVWTYSFSHGHPVQSAFTPDGKLWNVVVRQAGRTFVDLFDISSYSVAQLFSPETARLVGADAILSSDGTRVVVTDGRSVAVFRVADGKQVTQRDLPPDPPVIRYAFDAALTKMLLASVNSVRLWDLSSGTVQSTIQVQQTPSMVALSPRVNAIAIAFADGSANLYTGPGFANIRQIRAKGDPPLKTLAFGADGKFVYALCTTGPVEPNGPGFYLWRVELPNIPANPSWPQLAGYFKAVAGSCPNPTARQEIFFETPDDARRNYDRCRAQEPAR